MPKSPTDPPSSDQIVVLWRVRVVVMLVRIRVYHGGGLFWWWLRSGCCGGGGDSSSIFAGK